MPLWKPRKGDRVVIVKGWYQGFCGTVVRLDKKVNQYIITDLVRYKTGRNKPEDYANSQMHFPLTCMQPFRYYKHIKPYLTEDK